MLLSAPPARIMGSREKARALETQRMTPRSFYHLNRPARGFRQVEAWSGYPLQFAGQRRFRWQDQMAADLHAALAQLAVMPGETLAGTYLSTDQAPCDAENRLFTNPGAAGFPQGILSIRFEKGAGPPPLAPVPVASVDGHFYYIRYRPGGSWQWWEPGATLARWSRVPRHFPDDGSCRPVWLAMKQAAAAGAIDVLASGPVDTGPVGVRLVVHATGRGPRSAPAISETLIDGTVAAFHRGARDAGTVAAALAGRMPRVPLADLEKFAGMNSPGPFFSAPLFIVRGSYVQLNPCDERCHAGEVMIRPDARGSCPEISGELFTVRRTPP